MGNSKNKSKNIPKDSNKSTSKNKNNMKDKDVVKEIKSDNKHNVILEKRYKLPIEIKRKIYKDITFNIFIAICLMLYFIILVLGYKNIDKDVYIIDLKVFSISLLIASIFIFEKAFKKDNGKLAIRGIEVLVIAFFSLSMQYFLFGFTNLQNKLIIPNLIIIFFAIYYCLKSIIIDILEKKKYKNSLSDVKEIIDKKGKNNKWE